MEIDKHLEVGACPFPHCGKLESWKARKTRPCCCNPGTQSSPDLQQRKTRIGQLDLCRMKLPYRQRQQERAPRVRRDHKLALCTAFAALFLVTTSVVSAAATIQPPEVRRTAITRERLRWNDHADKSEREGTFQWKYRMKRRTFKNLVALLGPALERDYCKNSILDLRFRRHSKLIYSTSRAYKIRVCILQVLQQMDQFSLW